MIFRRAMTNMKKDLQRTSSPERAEVVEDLKSGDRKRQIQPGQRLVEIILSNVLAVTRGKVREAPEKA